MAATGGGESSCAGRGLGSGDRSGRHSGQGTDGELNTHQVRLDDLADPFVDGAVLTADTMGVAREVLV